MPLHVPHDLASMSMPVPRQCSWLGMAVRDFKVWLFMYAVMLVPVQPHVPAMHVLGASLAAWELTHVSRGRRSNVGTRTMVHSCFITDVGLLLVLRAGPIAMRAGPQ